MWILIIASVCYPTTINLAVGSAALSTPSTVPPVPSIESKSFPTREALDAFVLQRIVWGPCSETLAAVGPDGNVYRVKKVEKMKIVVREVTEHDGFKTEWTPAPEVLP